MVAQIIAPAHAEVRNLKSESKLAQSAPAQEVLQASGVPVIDLAGISDPAQRKRIVEEIGTACEEWGFFQIVNHQVPLDVLESAFSASKDFFAQPLEEKLKARPAEGTTPVPTGFRNDDITHGVLDRKEHLLFFSEGDTRSTEITHPYSQYNVWPSKPDHFSPLARNLIKESELQAVYMMGLVSESLGLPTNFIHEHYKEKTNAFAFFMYPPSPGSDGFPPHKDGNVLTVLAQNNVGGLQVLKNGEWVNVTPIKGALIINVGDMIQVWSNSKYKSVTHRVKNDKVDTRYSFAFFCTPGIETWVEPLDHFMTQGQPARYSKFQYKEYMMHRFENKRNPSKEVAEVGIDIYAI